MITRSTCWAILLCFTLVFSAHGQNVTTVTFDGVSFTVNKTQLTAYVEEMRTVKDSLLSCKKYSATVHHPLNARSSGFIVNPHAGVCQFSWLRDMKWHYSCTLNKKEQVDMAESLSAWIEKQGGLGDFSEPLMNLLFNPELCSTKRL